MFYKLDEEHYVENSFLFHLQRLGWKIYRQNKDNPEDTKEIISFTSSLEPEYGESQKFRESFKEVILEGVLRESLKRINPWIEDDQISEVVRRIITPQSNSLLEANKEIHDLLLENTSVSENRKTGEKSPTVKFIDFKNPDNNSFIAISQFKVNITGTEKHIVPDIVLFVNGLPLVVVECKSPAVADPISEAITQLMRYCNRRGVSEGNEKLFWYNLFVVATSNQVAKYGTVTSEYEHFVEWKDPYPFSLSDVNPDGNVTSQQVLIHGMLSKENLLDLLHTFTIFKEDPKSKMVKVVARYQQFRAVKKMVKRLKEGKTPDERGGIVWHTQGSGKSLTMMFMVRELYHNPEFGNYKVVFVTDRRDLEKQLNETSKSVGFTVRLARSINELKELLKTNTPELVMAIVHKFQERELEGEFPVLNTSSNILIMIDEAHRTQYKLLGANLRKALPNATKIAFTGTPIEKTEITFGDYIDKYSIKQAVEDGVTVDIVYEGRVHSAEISDEEAANAKFEDVFSDADKDTKRMIMGKFVWKAYLEAEEVIRDKARDMIEHYIAHIFPNKFKAQVVTASRLAAIRYKRALEESLKEKIFELEKENNSKIDLETLKKLEVGVVISGAQNDPPEYRNYTDPNEHERIIKSFRLPFDKVNENGISGNVGILVVQNMLITGFDAPIEQVMYLDNVIKGHNLLQAIARVNRVYKNKSCGFVVDYVGVLKHLKEALAIYADEDIEEISQVVKDKAKSIDELKYVHNLIEEFFKKHGIRNWREDIDECIDILVDKNIRNEFIALVRRFNHCMDEVLPDFAALKYLTDLKILAFIKESARNVYRDDKLSIKDASNKIREIVEEYLISKGIDPKIPPTPLLEDKFLEKLHRKTSKVKTQELKNAIIEHIEEYWEEDPEFYERFSDRLKKILEEYKENWDALYEELKKLREEVKKGREVEQTFGFEPKKEMPFFGLIKSEIFGKKTVNELTDSEIDFLVNTTRDVIEIIKREVQKVDFWENPTKQNNLKSYLTRHLIKLSSPAFKRKHETVSEEHEPYMADIKNIVHKKRNEIAQKLIELAYYHFRK
ncbi:type I restriction endonuclease subunit R [Fervidobacterium nodosum]|uniref:Type I restriction enzyme endonuclease subunit n=1 Tax=Fervidobacterium nodosum (strain ATCC 35602 / DSM 5306 / Rt17-B1) TaxID=381764 RepID=A7HKD5_FERNB|nr:type I restriction endonuclease subunit R [Fervidobacterium nodosum]ABS60368.1 type I site-specific deoxyribonuclease, HsdR family [Fervidobacterium nodosum Rt17-B1]